MTENGTIIKIIAWYLHKGGVVGEVCTLYNNNNKIIIKAHVVKAIIHPGRIEVDTVNYT